MQFDYYDGMDIRRETDWRVPQDDCSARCCRSPRTRREFAWSQNLAPFIDSQEGT